MVAQHPLIPAFAFEEGKEQTPEAMSTESTAHGFTFANFNSPGATVEHSLSLPAFPLSTNIYTF